MSSFVITFHFDKGIFCFAVLNNVDEQCNTLLIFFRAIKKFTSAIKVDPTYVRAYVCRGEAYSQLHDVSSKALYSQA